MANGIKKTLTLSGTSETLLMSVEEMRSLGGCHDMTDEEVVELIQTMQRFAVLTYRIYRKAKASNHEQTGSL